MFCYAIHQTQLWRKSKLTEGQRNVRILFVGLIFYFVLHAISWQYKDKYTIFKLINKYFILIMVADVILCACLYKLYYGRSIVHELNTRETDYYDSKTHRYYKEKQTNDKIQKEPTNDPIEEKEPTKDPIEEKEKVIENDDK